MTDLHFPERARRLWDALFSADFPGCHCVFPDRPDPKCLEIIDRELADFARFVQAPLMERE